MTSPASSSASASVSVTMSPSLASHVETLCAASPSLALWLLGVRSSGGVHVFSACKPVDGWTSALAMVRACLPGGVDVVGLVLPSAETPDAVAEAILAEDAPLRSEMTNQLQEAPFVVLSLPASGASVFLADVPNGLLTPLPLQQTQGELDGVSVYHMCLKERVGCVGKEDVALEAALGRLAQCLADEDQLSSASFFFADADVLVDWNSAVSRAGKATARVSGGMKGKSKGAKGKKPSQPAAQQQQQQQRATGTAIFHVDLMETCSPGVMDDMSAPTLFVERTEPHDITLGFDLDVLLYAPSDMCAGDVSVHLVNEAREQVARHVDLLSAVFLQLDESYALRELEGQYVSALAGLVTVARVSEYNTPSYPLLTRAVHVHPSQLAHALCLLYPVTPVNEAEEYLALRHSLHQAFGLPSDRPLVRMANAVRMKSVFDDADDAQDSRLADVHLHTKPPKGGNSATYTVDGSYLYYHYGQDSIRDSGWGCAYRTFQTQASWLQIQNYTSRSPPSHREIQETLVNMGVKKPSFVGSTEWIGSQELRELFMFMYGVDARTPYKAPHDEVPVRELVRHFEQQGTPCMIGGAQRSYGLLGVALNEQTGEAQYLILDPHYEDIDDINMIVRKGWCGWKKADFFLPNTEYHFCCPIRPNAI